MAILKYNVAKQYCISAGITTRDQYRELRCKNVKDHNQLPPEFSIKNQYGKDWKGWDDFLRNPKLVPENAQHLGNNYYHFENSIYNHTSKGFMQLAKRHHPDGKMISDIRTTEGKVISVYLDKTDIPISKYLTVDQQAQTQ